MQTGKSFEPRGKGLRNRLTFVTSERNKQVSGKESHKGRTETNPAQVREGKPPKGMVKRYGQGRPNF